MESNIPLWKYKRKVFSFGGKLVGHLPVCKRLQVATSIIKCRASTLTKGWDDHIDDIQLKNMLTETMTRGKQLIPAEINDVWAAKSFMYGLM